MRYFALLFLFCLPLAAQPVGVGGTPIACLAAPGNTVAPYRTQCQVAGTGAIWACNQVAGCTLAAHWAAVAGSGSGLAVIASSVTYYVCTQANGTTCGSTDTTNGWHSNATVSTTISDTNNCTAAATPCATLQGVETKIHGQALAAGAVVTIYVADEANTGTDCLAPSQVTFTNYSQGVNLFIESERAVQDVFPTSYIYVYGNPTTKANVTLAGNGCGVSASFGSVSNAITAAGPVALRVRGFQIEGFGKTNLSYSGVVIAEGGATIFVEDIASLAVSNSHNSIALASGPNTMMRLGGTNTIVGAAATHSAYTCAFKAICTSWDPLATVSTNSNFTLTGTGTGLFAAVDGADFKMDRTTWNNSATNNGILFANSGGYIWYTEAYANSQCPAGGCFFGTNSGTGVTYQTAQEGGKIDADCLNFNEGSCVMSVQVQYHSYVQVGGWVREYATGGSNTAIITSNALLGTDSIQGGCVSTFNQNSLNELTNCVPGMVYFSTPAADTLVCSTITTTETAFASTYRIPASTLIAGKLIQVSWGFANTSPAAPTTNQGRVRLSTSSQSGASSPTGTAIWVNNAVAPSANQTAIPFTGVFNLVGTATPGASVAVTMVPIGGGQAPFQTTQTTSNGQTVATNGDLWVTLSLNCGASTAGQSVQLTTFAVSYLN